MSSENIIHLCGCLTRGSWPLHLPPPKLQNSGRAVFTQPLTTTCVDRQGLSNAGRTKSMVFSIFKQLTSYVQCLWSPLLSDQGVLSELFVTVMCQGVVLWLLSCLVCRRTTHVFILGNEVRRPLHGLSSPPHPVCMLLLIYSSWFFLTSLSDSPSTIHCEKHMWWISPRWKHHIKHHMLWWSSCGEIDVKLWCRCGGVVVVSNIKFGRLCGDSLGWYLWQYL